MAIVSVLSSYEVAVLGQEFNGVGVLGLKSRRESTASRSYGARPVARKPDRTVSSPIEAKKACLKAGKKSSLVI